MLRGRATKAALGTIAALLVAFVLVTAWALESGGVAVIETHAPDGALRTTHVWHAESDGELWLEAGAPENAWFTDVQRDPRVVFTADESSAAYLAKPVDEPAAQARIRAWLRAKYGLRDRWVGLFVDSSRSVAVRLVRAAPTPQ